MKTLNQVKVGETVKVTKIAGEGPIKRRIMDMGITKGVEIYVRKVAPLGDPVEITVRNYELSVRKADALRAEPSESGSVKNYNHGQLYYIYDCVKCKKDKERNHGNYNCTRR